MTRLREWHAARNVRLYRRFLDVDGHRLCGGSCRGTQVTR